ncbi:radial spoke head 10 homolog B [Platichthys flesus]|uniref:radial spoke head 10 homolog B n=1 Tax=Platichthys flesus TaxID=8260 RepID=UPI002DB8F270|nr:radial spoke head 10 homolog B [Platichthys flesus]
MYQLPATLFNLVLQRHEGETREGRCHGNGVACFEGGHMYKGMFAKGLMDGPGVFLWAGGFKYEGEFVCNKPMGQGTYTWPDGGSYKGEVYDGVRHGTGTYECAKSAVTYTGQWDQGKRHGKGEVFYDQSKTSWYMGDWVRNSREGFGVRCYPSGDIYSGEWRNNLRHGQGTMRWLQLGQEYTGMWQDGVQQGRGTHIWMLRRTDGSQYAQNNRYTGDFVQGQRHGRGTFFYAGGAFYEGEMRNDKKHGKGKFTSKDGHVFEGEFVDDQMITNELKGALPPTGNDPSVLVAEMALNIDSLLNDIPEKKRDTERMQVEFVVLRQDAELRSIYSFYRSLGQSSSPDESFLLCRLQLWRLLKDCNIHHHGISLTEIDNLMKEDSPTQIHSPYTPMSLTRLLSCLVLVAHHIYSKDMESQKYLLASCFSKLMTDDILPNAKNVKGLLFGRPHLSAAALNYTSRCWDVYQAHCRVQAPPRVDQTMTCRHLLWMFKDLGLLGIHLTPVRLLDIIMAESQNPSCLSSYLNLEHEITFLEFFEVLLSIADIKCLWFSEKPPEESSPPFIAAEETSDLPEAEDSEKIGPTSSSAHSKEDSIEAAESSPAQDVIESQQDVKTKVCEEPQSPVHREDEMETNDQTIHQFFQQFFFPAFDHYQLETKLMEEEKLYS